MIRTLAVIMGLLFIAGGVLGFIPQFAPGGMLLDLFRVNAIHNLIHICTGIIALWVGFTSNSASKIFFQIFGILYALVTIVGIMHGDAPIFGLIANNKAGNWLHAIIAVLFLYFGFGLKAKK